MLCIIGSMCLSLLARQGKFEEDEDNEKSESVGALILDAVGLDLVFIIGEDKRPITDDSKLSSELTTTSSTETPAPNYF